MLLKTAQDRASLLRYAVRAMINELGAQRAFGVLPSRRPSGDYKAHFGFETEDFIADPSVNQRAIEGCRREGVVLVIDARHDPKYRCSESQASLLCASFEGGGLLYCDHSTAAGLGNDQKKLMHRVVGEVREQLKSLPKERPPVEKASETGSGIKMLPVALVVLLVALAPWIHQYLTRPAPPPEPETVTLTVRGRVDQEVQESVRIAVKLPELNQKLEFYPRDMRWDPVQGTYEFTAPLMKTKEITQLALTFRSKGRLRTARVARVSVRTDSTGLLAEVPSVKMVLPTPGQPRDPNTRPSNLVQRQTTPDPAHAELAEKLKNMEAGFRKENEQRPKVAPAQPAIPPSF